MSKNQKKIKQKILDELEKIPIVGMACQRAGIGRSTYYRWLEDDAEFQNKAEVALNLSCQAINDLAESKLINGIKEDKHQSISFWLRHNHPKYYTPAQQTVNYRVNPKDKQINPILVHFIGGEGVEYDSFEAYKIADDKFKGLGQDGEVDDTRLRT